MNGIHFFKSVIFFRLKMHVFCKVEKKKNFKNKTKQNITSNDVLHTK